MTTVRALIQQLASDFRAAGLDSPEVDAKLLAGAAAGMTAHEMVLQPDKWLDDREIAGAEGFRQRRLAHEPVSRILGRRDFYGRTFEIGPATLDPRPDTETLIEAALEIATEAGWRGRPIRILDVGTGSGAILLTLLAELPLASGLATDISAGALEVAARNAERLGVAGRASFAMHRSLEGIEGPFDLVVSNPPYIPAGEIGGLEPEVREHDPRTALDGGADGLDVYRALGQGLVRVVPSGWLAVEVGAGQAAAVAEILGRAAGKCLKSGRIRRDLGGHERCVAVETQKVLMTH